MNGLIAKIERDAQRAEERAAYEESPVGCRRCRKPMSFGKWRRGDTHCGQHCANLDNAIARTGKPIRHS